MSFYEKDWAPGRMPDGSIVTFPDIKSAAICDKLYKKAFDTNKPEDWKAWEDAVEQYRDKPAKEAR